MEFYIAADKSDTQYVLQNMQTGQMCAATFDEIKQAIKNKEIIVANLTLTKDNRLVLSEAEKVDAVNDALMMGRHMQELIANKNLTLYIPSKEVTDMIEASTDVFMKRIAKYITNNFNGLITAQVVDDRSNILIIKYGKASGSYVVVEYKKFIWGGLTETDDIYGTIMDVGIDVRGFQRGKEGLRITSSPFSLAGYTFIHTKDDIVEKIEEASPYRIYQGTDHFGYSLFQLNTSRECQDPTVWGETSFVSKRHFQTNHGNMEIIPDHPLGFVEDDIEEFIPLFALGLLTGVWNVLVHQLAIMGHADINNTDYKKYIEYTEVNTTLNAVKKEMRECPNVDVSVTIEKLMHGSMVNSSIFGMCAALFFSTLNVVKGGTPITEIPYETWEYIWSAALSGTLTGWGLSLLPRLSRAPAEVTDKYGYTGVDFVYELPGQKKKLSKQKKKLDKYIGV